MSTRPARQANETDLDRFRQHSDLWEQHIHSIVAVCDTDESAKHTDHGPLSGLTVGVKDIIDVAGIATRNGSDACKDAPSAIKDAKVVASLRAAGAQIVAKTTTTEFAFTDPTACRNPFDLNRTPGGSSSGSGAAVAAGVVDIALGTQTAGSLCRPAAYCGTVGFKPTHGALSNAGVTPLAPSFDSVGVIAGTVAQAQAAFAVMAPWQSHANDAPEPKAVCGLWPGDVTPETDVLAALEDAARVSACLGVTANEISLQADVDQIVKAHRTVMNYEAAMAHGAMLDDRRAEMLKPKFLAGLRAGAAISPDAAAHATAVLADAKQAFWAGLARVDVVLTLPVPDGPPLIDGTTGYQDWLTPWTVFGGPLICLPWGLDRLGRPRSVMLAGRPGQDAALFAFASRLEENGPPRPLPCPPKA